MSLLHDLREGAVARAVYLAAAFGTAWLFALSGNLRSVQARRSVGTGEILFGRSDIDLALILRDDRVEGKHLERLYQFHRAIGCLNPALGHVHVFRAEDLARCASQDSVWQAMEDGSFRRLWGEALRPGTCQVRPSHALREFLTWLDAFLPSAVAHRDRRNCKKHALECWNYFALAQGLLTRPLLTRPCMQEHLSRLRNVPGDLDTPAGSVRFILELANELHSSRLAPLTPLQAPLVFKRYAPPHGLQRTYVVLPTPQSLLPEEAFGPGSFIATPELLDLYVRFKNGFFSWIKPPELSLSSPTVEGFLSDLLHYLSPHFLCWPGFVEPGRNPLDPAAKFAYLAHAFEWLAKGKLPPPLTRLKPTVRIQNISRYYLETYDDLRRRTDGLAQSIAGMLRCPE